MYCSKEMKSFECPFTWNISRDLSQNFDEDQQLETVASDQQVIALVNAVMAVYCSVTKQNYGFAKRKIIEADNLWKKMDLLQLKVERVSLRALKHILDSTKYHAYHLSRDTQKATSILSQIVDAAELSSKIELATIHGFRALAYSSFHEAARFEALDDAKIAISHFKHCPLWYFALYKSLRHKRRKVVKFGSKPCEEEKQAILQCINLSEKAFYLVHAAQMHRENKNHLRASMLYKKTLKANPQSMGILLRLAFGFIKCGKEINLAKKCLDVVERNNPDNSMFLHYKAIYMETLGDFKEAAKYYKQASKNNNFPADILYAVCLKKAGEPIDCVQYLKQLLNKYNDNDRVLQIWLHLALQYYNKSNFKEACRCFIKAIEIDRKSEYLKVFKNSLIDGKFVNIFDLIKLDLIFKCDDEEMTFYLEELCV
ncbi:uncharacterized protein LOC131673318 [Phymastichus coffea]|uniref:uncharacterized protein LOC131673318 n=1 Tax=Phymastichus coffea TaxID=108790 RepID=UPI00273B38D4|nr:uncharacterized protein LOC131673318 [Phymastichus coffea]